LRVPKSWSTVNGIDGKAKDAPPRQGDFRSANLIRNDTRN
jgi:hypothetical protein